MMTTDKKVFSQSALSYLTVTIIILICIFPVYQAFDSAQREKSVHAIESYGEIALSEFVAGQASILNTARTLYTDPELRRLYYESPSQKDRFFQATLVQKRLNVYFENLPNIENVILYLKKYDFVITSQYLFPSKELLHHYIHPLDLQGETEGIPQDWLTELPDLAQNKIGFFHSRIHDTISGTISNGLHYVYSFPLVGDHVHFDIQLIVSRDAPTAAKEFLHPDLAQTGYAQLVSKSGKILAEYRGDPASGPQDPDAFTVLSITHPSGLCVRLGVPNKYLRSFRHNSLRFIITNFLVALLIGLVFSLWFAYQRTKPLERIMSALRASRDSTELSSDLHDLEGSILDMIDEISSCKSTINELDLMVSNSLKNHLFYTGLTEDQTESFAKHFGSFCLPCVVLSVFGPDLKPADSEAMQSLADRLTARPFLLHTTAQDSLCLLSAEDACIPHVSAVLRTLRSEAHRVLYVGISMPFSDLRHAADAVRAARRRLHSGVKFPGVYLFTHTHSTHSLSATVCVQDLELLERVLLAGESDSADKIISRIIETSVCDKWDSVELQQLFFLLRTVYSSVLRHMGSEAERLGTLWHDAPQLADELEEYDPRILESFCLELNAALSAQAVYLSQISSHNLGDQIVEYINQNFADTSLCASAIADAFRISEKYVFQLVKNSCGETLNMHLCTLRINEAIRLLQTTTLSVSEIAQRTGFTSANSMYKVFIRIKGISPSSYRPSKSLQQP